MAGAIVRTNPNRKTTTKSTGGGTNKDKDYLSSAQQQQIAAAQNKWQAAYAAGDQAGMDAAHREAESIRNSAGYTSDSSGNYVGTYSPSGGGSGSGGGNSQYTGTNTGSNSGSVYAPDYQSFINDAVERGDFKSAAMYEQLRNQKIKDLGLDYATTNLYGSYLEDQTPQQNQQDSLSAILEYMQNWQRQNQKPAEYETDPRIMEMYNDIVNRDKFSYNVENDPLYQQYLQTAQREGDRVMRETLAEAATSAGGMNSYAITAAQQANNYYNSQLNDKIPELYQLAYDKYLKDIDNQVRDLGLLQSMDETQYNRYRNTMNDWQNDKSFAYGMYNDAVNQGNWQTTHDYNSMWDNINYYTDNSWKNKEWDAGQAQLERENSLVDQETARKEIEWYIENGVTTINPDLIKRAGLDETAINQMIEQKQLEEALKTKYKSSGGGGGSKEKSPTSPSNAESPIVSDDEPIVGSYSPFDSLVNAGGVYQAVQLLLEQQGRDAALAYLNDAIKTGVINQSAYNMIYQQYLK